MLKQAEFLGKKQHVAFYGLKRNGKGFARDVLNGLREAYPQKQFTIVHPMASELQEHSVSTSAAAIEPSPDYAIVVLKAADAKRAIDDAYQAGIARIWLAIGCDSQDNLSYARELGMDAIGGCPLLFAPGQGFPHNFHRWLAKLFGKL